MYHTSIMVEKNMLVGNAPVMKQDDPSAKEIINTLASLTQRLHRQRDILLSQGDDRGVTLMAYTILVRLATHPMKANEIAELYFSDPSTISRQVKQLVDEDLVTKIIDENDKRVYILTPTQKGYEKVKEMKIARDKFYSDLLAEWTEQEKTQFIELFGRFVESIEIAAGRCK